MNNKTFKTRIFEQFFNWNISQSDITVYAMSEDAENDKHKLISRDRWRDNFSVLVQPTMTPRLPMQPRSIDENGIFLRHVEHLSLYIWYRMRISSNVHCDAKNAPYLPIERGCKNKSALVGPTIKRSDCFIFSYTRKIQIARLEK